MKNISILKMLLLAVDHHANKPAPDYTFYYKDPLNTIREIVQMDLLKEFFVTSNGDIVYYDDVAAQESIFIKVR